MSDNQELTNKFCCDGCENIFHEDEKMTDKHGCEYYCQDCFAERFIPCYDCGDECEDKDIVLVEHLDIGVCRECYTAYTECEEEQEA